MGKEKDAQVIEAAGQVFLRYGFRRTTMGDLAQAAGVSRPALYLRFCNKEKVFEAVLKDFAGRVLAEIRAGLVGRSAPLDQLRFAFECWVVRSFVLLQGFPDAGDMVNCSLPFMAEVKSQSCAEFEALLAPVLARMPVLAGRDAAELGRIAHMLVAAAHGLKGEARDADELRGMLDTLLGFVVG